MYDRSLGDGPDSASRMKEVISFIQADFDGAGRAIGNRGELGRVVFALAERKAGRRAGLLIVYI